MLFKVRFGACIDRLRLFRQAAQQVQATHNADAKSSLTGAANPTQRSTQTANREGTQAYHVSSGWGQRANSPRLFEAMTMVLRAVVLVVAILVTASVGFVQGSSHAGPAVCT